MTPTKIVTPKAPAKEVVKDASMLKQKAMMAAHYDRLTSAPETGAKVAATFVPGNLNELVMCFDLLNNLPEVNAIQSGLRRVSGGYVLEAEKIGHSEDVCTYVKADLGMMMGGESGPTGDPLPRPDILLLSYTGCFTFMKWFELLREQYKCETIMLHTPYMGDGKITKGMIDYMVKQLREEVIPTLERVSGGIGASRPRGGTAGTHGAPGRRHRSLGSGRRMRGPPRRRVLMLRLTGDVGQRRVVPVASRGATGWPRERSPGPVPR